MKPKIDAAADLTGRVFIAWLFAAAGFSKISGYAGTQGWMEAAGVPGMLLPLVIALEIGGALAIIAGFQTRLVALALAGFSVMAAIVFHADFSQQAEAISFMKNVALAGGFLFLVSKGAGAWSVDGWLSRRRAAA